jgi:hypothetical protein
MESISDLLDSKLICLSDQLELAVTGWANYHQQDSIAEHLYYDVYDLVGTFVEIIYLDFPEYTVEMARNEASNICRKITDKLVLVIESLKDQLASHILPVLKDGDEDTRVGAVAMVGGDMAVRIDDVKYHADVDVLDSHPNQ